MDSDLPVQSDDVPNTKPSFRKPSNDATNRKYRRHSSGGGSDSSLSDGSPSPRHEKGNRTKDERKYSDRNRPRDAGEGEKNHSKSSRSARESWGRDNQENSSLQGSRNFDKFSRSDYGTERRSRDHASDNLSHRSEHRRHNDRYLGKYQDRAERNEKTHSRSVKEREHESLDRARKDRDHRGGEERKKEKGSRDDQLEDSSSKKHKASLLEKPIAAENVRASPCSSKEKNLASGSSSSPAEISQDFNAAKAAAMKAAELVNKNLTGCGLLSTAQKKKLLWGSKKNEPQEEASGSRWDVPVFSDRERQEKFNKLMGVKGELKSTHQSQPEEKEKELQMELEKQYTAGLRRRDGRTVGLGL